MLGLIVLSVLVVGLAGGIIALIFNNTSLHGRITLTEYFLGMVGFTFIIAPVTSFVGYQLAINDLIYFNEYWGGWELDATTHTTNCYKDGPCWHEYDCDPYWVEVEVCSGSGEDRECRTERERRYHSCPYTTHEISYYVETTLGTYTIAEHWLPENPNNHRWDSWVDVPNWVQNSAGVGIPVFWDAANLRINAGNPDPVTSLNTYKNLILAADNSLLQSYSPHVERYLELELLPDITRVSRDIYDYYYANKVYFVGFTPDNPESWYQSLSSLNGALGSELYGDLHLVIVNNDQVANNPDEYINALKAYWQNPEVWGDDTLAKNTILVVVGTSDNQTVSWARATTGMPLGNSLMEIIIRDESQGVLLTPETLIGNIQPEFYTDENGDKRVRTTHGSGFLETVIWGLDNPNTRFERVSMSAEDEDDVGLGFLYLNSGIEPKFGQKLAIWFTAFILGLLVWGFMAHADIPSLFNKN